MRTDDKPHRPKAGNPGFVFVREDNYSFTMAGPEVGPRPTWNIKPVFRGVVAHSAHIVHLARQSTNDIVVSVTNIKIVLRQA